MEYTVPLLMDGQQQITGLFSTKTTQGDLVVLFSNKALWRRFSDPVSRVLRSNGQYLGSFEIQAESFGQAVEQLAQIYPDMLNEATFVPDSTPVVEEIIAFFTQTAA